MLLPRYLAVNKDNIMSLTNTIIEEPSRLSESRFFAKFNVKITEALEKGISLSNGYNKQSLFDFSGDSDNLKLLKTYRSIKRSEFQETKRRRQTISLYDYYNRDKYDILPAPGEHGIRKRQLKGDKILAKIRYMLDNIVVNGKKIVRNNEQVKFIDAYVQALLPKIYDTEWHTNSERILKQEGIRKIWRYVISILARRGGKTW